VPLNALCAVLLRIIKHLMCVHFSRFILILTSFSFGRDWLFLSHCGHICRGVNSYLG
jgi:hypothetical protein